MGDFRSFERDRGDRDSRPRFGGRGRNFSSGGRGRSFGGGRDRRDMPDCDAVCAKCGKNCKVPFKPTGDKPVYCSECFGAGAGAARDGYKSPIASVASSGITQEQIREINKKLDKILGILNSLEMVEEDEEGETEEAKNESEDVIEAEKE